MYVETYSFRVQCYRSDKKKTTNLVTEFFSLAQRSRIRSKFRSGDSSQLNIYGFLSRIIYFMLSDFLLSVHFSYRYILAVYIKYVYEDNINFWYKYVYPVYPRKETFDKMLIIYVFIVTFS